MATVVSVPYPEKDHVRSGWAVKRVVIADDHPRVRAGIRNLLEKAADIQILGEATDGEEALTLVEEYQPDVLILDIEMPKLNGIEVASRLKARGYPVKILVLSGYHERRYVQGMLANGVAGYLTKDEVPEKIVKAVRGVARGEMGWISRKLAPKIGVWETRRSQN